MSRSLVLLAILAGGLVPSAPIMQGDQRPGDPADRDAQAARFAEPEDPGLERVWIGPDWWANRLQDWRRSRGRIECVTGDERLPLRTLHRLTRSIDGPGAMTMRVTTGAIGTDGVRGWSGFLIGAGGPGIDPRLTAMVHHRPAEDGGLLCVVDGQGRVAFRDNSTSAREGGPWSVGGPLAPEEATIIHPSAIHGNDRAAAGPVTLQLVMTPAGATCRLTLTAFDAAGGGVLSEAVLDDVACDDVAGCLALVSHLGAADGTGYWFDGWTMEGTAVGRHDERRFGPVLGVLYTLGADTLGMSAQMGPLGAGDTRTASLEVLEDGVWRSIGEAELVEDSQTFHFAVEAFDAERDRRFRVVYDLVTPGGGSERHAYEGTIRAEPVGDDDFVIASLSCHKIFTGGLKWNHDGLWFPHAELVEAVREHAPDLLYFAGDQIYEGDLDPAQRSPEDAAVLDYLYKWTRWCWAFGELTRHTPCVTIPDDHDVYHGNLWGAGGRRATRRDGLSAQDSGGYRMSPRFVNAVHRTQTGHLPPSRGRSPIGAGYTTYFTRLDYGGVSFAILADRQFKSSPSVMVPDGDVVNGWFRNPEFDPRDADVPNAVLLGAEQLEMLEAWATDYSNGVWTKVALSQTPFANIATLPDGAANGSVLPGLEIPRAGEYPEAHRLAADADSNGWPQSGRNAALRAMRRGFAIHLTGDQHLGSLVEYGIDGWRDAGYVFSSPAIANTWPRRWFPPEPGANRDPAGPKYAGDYRDGFGNHMTVHAIANPVVTGRRPARLYDRAPGYGIVRLARVSGRVTFECWPRWARPADPDARQFTGWPRTIEQVDNHGSPVGWLPTVEVRDAKDFQLRVIDETTGEVESARRVRGETHRPAVFGRGPYTIEVGDRPNHIWWRGLGAGEAADRVLRAADLGRRAAKGSMMRMLPGSTFSRVAAVAAVLSTPSPSVATPEDDRRPNIIFIFADDHACRAVGAYESPITETPNIDRIAKEGMVFGNCMVTNAICGPSRAVILTGLHSHLNGFRQNGNTFDNTQRTFPKLLRAGGYQTAVIGKWHLKSDPTGFDHHEILIGQGPYYNPPMMRNGAKVAHGGYTTDVITDLAIEWLRDGRNPERPFMLMVQHKAPHRSWQPGPGYFDRFDGTMIPEPSTLFDDLATRGTAARTSDMSIERTLTDYDLKFEPPRNLSFEQMVAWRAGYEAENAAFHAAEPTGRDLVRWKYQRYLKDYLRCIASLDANVGRLLDVLDETSLSDDTIVIYSSDQGFFLGEHGWFDKRFMYEPSLRTPLLVRWPGVTPPGSESDALVSNLDFAETFLDAAGLEVPDDMQGRSLVPLLKGTQPADWRRSVYYHYYEYPGTHEVRRHEGVRDARYKLIHFYGVDEWELYDLEEDPEEVRNVHGDERYAVVEARLRSELARLRAIYRVPENEVPAVR